MKFKSLTACALLPVAPNQLASASSRISSSFRIIGIGEFGVGYRVHERSDDKHASENAVRAVTLARTRLSTAAPPVCSSALSVTEGCARLMAEAGSCDRALGTSWLLVLNSWYTPRSSDAPVLMNDWESAVRT